MNPPAAILFDLDDTLLAFSAGRPNFWRAALQEQAPELAEADGEAFVRAIDDASALFWAPQERAVRGRLDLFWARRQVAELAFAELGWRARELAHAVADDFTRRKEQAVAPFPGALDLLEELHSRDVAMGLVTNGHPIFQRRKLERWNLARYFKVIRIEGEFGIGKPHPSIFRSALEELGVSPRAAWMVGDNLHADIAGAQALGLHTVWHDHAERGLPQDAPATPDRIIGRIAELM